MLDILQISNDVSGLIYCAASSAACVLGSFIITLDVIWRWLFPQSKFDLNNNQYFLICSLSLSAGVLLFTSMYKLLPQGLTYFNNSTLLKDSPGLAQAVLIITYIVGVAICAVINTIIHTFTSKSLVHCAHDSHATDHGLEESLTEDSDSIPSAHKHSHTYNHPNYNSTPSAVNRHKNISSPLIPRATDANASGETIPLLAEAYRGSDSDSTENHIHTHSKDNTVNRKKSLMDMTQWTFRGKRYIGKCMGYGNIEDNCDMCRDPDSDCTNPHSIIDYIEPETMIHRHIHFNRSFHGNETVPRPACSNEDIQSYSNLSASIDSHNHEEPHLPRSSNSIHNHNETVNVDGNDIEASVHHHHVSTRYSHLFSIGLQTAFAISVHKIPEGFLTFATSHADRKLGFSVFLALAIHNVSEGFTIAFPLFLALQSRVMAITSAFVLGGLSQPLGALLAWGLLRSGLFPGGDDPVSNGKTQLVFGFIVSITAGFLSIIGLQMYGTAISFGGHQATTMAFAFLGILIIGLSSSLSLH